MTFRLSPAAERSLLELAAGWGAGELAAAPRDGDGWRRLTVDFQRELFAAAALLPLGAGVEMLEPPSLRARLARVAEELTRLYGRDEARGR